jgi:hypothetical protein
MGEKTMSCPLYKDFTRGCVTEFSDLVNAADFNYCDSGEGYKTCPFYRIINKEVTVCEYSTFCRKNQSYAALGMEKITEIAVKYCFSENKVNCEIYKLRKEGKEVPNNLLADGKTMELKSQ